MFLYPPSPNFPPPPPKQNLPQNSIMPLTAISDKVPMRVQHKVTQILTSFSTNPHSFTSFKFKIPP